MKTIPRGTKSKSAMRLVYLPVNAAYTFVVGENPLRMSDEPLFFQKRSEAVAAATRHGLGVAKSGLVHSVGENPFAKATGLSRRNERGGTWEDYFSGVEQALVEEGYKASVANDWRQIIRTSWASGKTIGEVLSHLIKLERESAKVARHERGDNPRVSRSLKGRIDRVLGKRRKS